MDNAEKDSLYIEHILHHIDALHRYLAGIADEDDFYANEQTMDACLMRLIVIGENVAKLSPELKHAYPATDWRAIKLTRNIYVHLYEGVDWQRVWKLLQNDIGTLEREIQNISEDLNKKNATN